MMTAAKLPATTARRKAAVIGEALRAPLPDQMAK
jgi:hypothetical protein